jgi:2-hydroxy-6-oxonona-2,4-dienedioate hydrolase
LSQQTNSLNDTWTMVDGVPIYARVSTKNARPDAPTIVMVHGFIISSRYMVPVAEQLAPHFRVYAVDLPGFGNSGEPGRVLNLDELADALARWMDVVGIERAVLLGNSFGCQVIARFAVRHPNRIQCAILVGPTVEPRRRTLAQQVLHLLADAPRERLKLWALHVPDYFRAGLRRILGTLRSTLDDRIEAYLPQMEVPTLIVRGTRDATISQEWVERATALLPRGRLVAVPGAHALNYSKPRKLARVVRAFLADCNAENDEEHPAGWQPARSLHVQGETV